MAQAKGIDLTTSYQGHPDFVQVVAAGYCFAMNKASEGTGYREEFLINWEAERLAGMLRNCYHFHRAASNGTLQADYFMNWARQGELPAMLDVEDGEALMIQGFSGAEIFDNVKACLMRLEEKWKRIPIVYTGMWYLRACMNDSPEYDFTWLKRYPLFIANYTGDPNIPPDKPDWWPWDFYQFTSSGSVPGIVSRTDLDVYKGTEAELRAWAGAPKENPTMIYNSAVQPIDRAKMIKITSDDARTAPGADPSAVGLDAQIIRCGGSYNALHQTWQDVAWDTRQKYAAEKKIPCIAYYEHDPAWYFFNGVDKGMIEARTTEQDPIAMQILRCLHTNPQATYQQMLSSVPSDWRPVQGIMISQFSTMDHLGREVGDFWYTLSIKNVLERLKSLMGLNFLPEIKIIFQLEPKTILRYATDPAGTKDLLTWLTYPGRNSWLWLSYKKWLMNVAHTDIPTLAECWPWAVLNLTDTFQFDYVPDGYDKRIAIFEVTGDRMYVPLYTTSAGINRPVCLSLFNDTAVVMKEWLKVTPPPPPDDLEARVTALEERVTILERDVATLAAIVRGEISMPFGKPFNATITLNRPEGDPQ